MYESLGTVHSADGLAIQALVRRPCRRAAGLRVFSERVRTAWRAGALVPRQPLVLSDMVRGIGEAIAILGPNRSGLGAVEAGLGALGGDANRRFWGACYCRWAVKGSIS